MHSDDCYCGSCCLLGVLLRNVPASLCPDCGGGGDCPDGPCADCDYTGDCPACRVGDADAPRNPFGET